MLSLATFGAGFVTRPIGALVIGAHADRVGRLATAAAQVAFMLFPETAPARLRAGPGAPGAG